MATIDGIEIYPIFSLLLFTVFFAVVTWKVISLRKTEIKKLENTPFD